MDLGRMFEFAVSRCPNQTALVEDGKNFTFSDVDQEVNRLAASLRKLGVGRRDRVMALLKNRRQTVCLFWALQKLGAIFSPVNYRMSVRDITYCVSDIEPKVIFYETSTYPTLAQITLDQKPILVSVTTEGGDVTYEELVKNEVDSFPLTPVDSNDVAIILYTSGSSGVPKGVPRTHGNVYAGTMALIVQNGYEAFESTLGVMPLYHTMGVHCLIAMTFLNGKYAITPEDFYPETILRLIEQQQITSLYMVPTMYRELVNHSRVADSHLSSLKKLSYAGASMSDELTHECLKIFQPRYFVNHYGSTEIHTFTTCSELDRKPGCAGRPGINQSLRIVELGSDALCEVETGKVGQIIAHIASPEAFKGYWNRPEITRDVIRGDWYFTGDIGYFDEEGDLYVVGRVDDMVISGLERVSPGKVETILNRHPKIIEVAVVGERDEELGQIVAAYVVCSDSALTPQELDRYCKLNKSLSAYERPRKYVFLNQLPKSPSGKVLKKQLTSKFME